MLLQLALTVHPAQHEDQLPTDWSQDGRFLLYVRTDWAAEPRKRSTDLWRYDVSTGADAAVVSTPADEEEAAISPDGRWLAYTSNETGRLQVFVRPFAGTTPRWQLSTEGGNMPQWRADSRQIAYITENRRIVGNAFSPDTGVHTGSPEVLFSHPGLRAYNLSRDFKRALVTIVPDDELAEPLTLVMNWAADWENGRSAVR